MKTIFNRPNARTLNALVSAAALLLALNLAAAPDEPLRAGVARTNITPAKPVTLAGYASRTNLSLGVHDPLSARAIAFEQGGKRLVLVSVDILGFYNGTAEPLRNSILEACRLESSELFLAAIHTHSAPSPALDPAKGHANNVEYTRTLQTQLPGLVQTALARLAPVRLAMETGAAPVGCSRREAVPAKTGPPQIKLGRNPAGFIDRTVHVLKITRAEDDALAAALFAYATHSTSMGPRNYWISGDVHGLAEQFLEQYVGNGLVAAGFAGASGDIDPWFRVLPSFNTTNGWIPEPVLLGTLLGEEVAHVLERTQPARASGPIRTAFKTLALPAKPAGGRTNAPGATASLAVTVGRVGDIAFVGLGGEVFNAIGRAIQAASPFPHTVVITHCNGAAGYLAPKECHAEGGYEITSSQFAPEAADIVVEEAGRLLREL